MVRIKNAFLTARKLPRLFVTGGAFVERDNGTDRHRNARKTRKTYCFSKDWDIHKAVTYFTMYSYPHALLSQDSNGGWPVRTPAVQAADGRLAASDPSDNRWPDRSRLAVGRMVEITNCSTVVRHKVKTAAEV